MTVFFKKPLVRWGLLLLVIVSVYYGVMSNLKGHSLYYLSQSHYDKTKLPEYVLLAENYEYLEFGGLDGKISRTYERIFDSVDDDIIYERDNDEVFKVGLLYDSYLDGRILDINTFGLNKEYILYQDGKVIHWLYDVDEVSSSDISTLRNLIAPIMATQKAPTVNLQLLFDLVYYKLLTP